jgi:hypothetical protein
LFGSLCVLYFAFIFFFRNRLSAKARNIGDRRKQLAPIISNFLFYGEDASKEEKYEYVELKVEIREFIKDPINRSILKEILLDLQRDLTGDARLRLFSLYRDFDLHLDAFEKLNSWRWEVVTKGITELTQMQVEQAYTIIKKFINHKRSVIRKQAQIATVSLRHEGISHFLDTNKYPISEWQQIKILEILRNKEDFIPPKFGNWLTSKNKDVVLFALRLIRHYNQTDANASVIELIKHRDDEVKQAATDCIKEFAIVEAIPTLMAAFKRSQRETKIFILDALGSLGKEEHIPYLLQLYHSESNFNIRSKALSAINTISPQSVLPIENLDPAIKLTETVPHRTEETAVEEPSLEIAEEEPIQTEAAEQEIEISEESSEFFFEDLDVFDHCFMEELNDILENSGKEEESVEVQYLPLDFLPIVVPKTAHMDKKKSKMKLKRRLRQIDVSFEEVHPDANFRKELEDILSRVEVPDLDGNMEVEYLNFKFLPFVVSEGDNEEKIPALLKQINEMEVDGVEIIMPQKELNGEDAIETVSDLPDEVDDLCALVDWGDLEGQEMSVETTVGSEGSKDEETKVLMGPSYGFSIFEELFRHSDAESKLILLDEILHLGDAKELSFLHQLVNDPNSRVRKKASEIALQLSEKLKKDAEQPAPNGIIVKWPDGDLEISNVSLDFHLNEAEITKKTYRK